MGDKISSYRNGNGDFGYHFHCEGCGSAHGVITKKVNNASVWKFNGSLTAPTFTPSILVRYPHSSPEKVKQSYIFKEKHGRFPTLEEAPHDRLDICHSFVKDGKIQYLNDCTHHLAGKTVELVDF